MHHKFSDRYLIPASLYHDTNTIFWITGRYSYPLTAPRVSSAREFGSPSIVHADAYSHGGVRSATINVDVFAVILIVASAALRLSIKGFSQCHGGTLPFPLAEPGDIMVNRTYGRLYMRSYEYPPVLSPDSKGRTSSPKQRKQPW